MDSRAPLRWWPGDTWIAWMTLWPQPPHPTADYHLVGVNRKQSRDWGRRRPCELLTTYWRSGPSVCIARQICICEYSTKRVLDLKTGVQVESNAEVKNAITVSYSWHFFVWHATGDLLSIDFRVIYIYIYFMAKVCHCILWPQFVYSRPRVWPFFTITWPVWLDNVIVVILSMPRTNSIAIYANSRAHHILNSHYPCRWSLASATNVRKYKSVMRASIKSQPAHSHGHGLRKLFMRL